MAFALIASQGLLKLGRNPSMLMKVITSLYSSQGAKDARSIQRSDDAFGAKRIHLYGPLQDFKFCTVMCISKHVYLYR